MGKIKALFISAAFMILAASAFAADATVTFVSGKVEVQRGGKWVALQKGDSVAKSETISTGFDSEAKIKILDSVMYLGPVTRITLEELSSKGQSDNVNVYLKTGTTRSQVRHTDNKRINYQVHTAVAVASCRGTDWVMDDSNSVSCLEGTVAVAAYQEPAEDEDTDSASQDGSDEDDDSEDKSDEKTEDKSEEKDGDSAETASGEGSEEKSSGSSGKEKNTPTSDDGVLVKANQSVTVSETSSVSAPVVAVVKTADAVTSTVSSAGNKEGVGGAGAAVAGNSGSAGSSASMPGTGNFAVKQTATVNVTIIVPADL